MDRQHLADDRALDSLEVSSQLPIGYGAVETLPLEPGRVQVVLDDVIAEGFARDLALVQRIDRLGQVVRRAWQILRRVGVATKLRGQGELVLDAVQPGGVR